MGLFHKAKVPDAPLFSLEEYEPVIRCSICTGEQVAGLVDLKTGVFEEIMVLRNEEDQMIFRQMAGKDSIRRFY